MRYGTRMADLDWETSLIGTIAKEKLAKASRGSKTLRPKLCLMLITQIASQTEQQTSFVC